MYDTNSEAKTNSTQTDEQLVALYLSGDQKALESLIQGNLNYVYNFIMGYVRDPQVAEDVSQDTFLKAWKNLKKFDDRYKFRTWLLTIAKNTALDYLKKKKNLSFSAISDDMEIIENLLVGEQNVEIDYFNIKSEIDKLPKKYQEILGLYYGQGLNFREIAETLRKSINTIKTQHRRAVVFLRKSIS